MTAPDDRRALRAALVRFHHGDPSAARSARLALPPAVVPAALGAARHAPSDSPWPLVVDLAEPDERFATPLGARDRGALPEDAELVELDLWAAVHLADLCARRRQRAARDRFSSEARQLVAAADRLLEADRARRPDEMPVAERVEPMGALGARLLDPARLAEIVGRRSAGAPLEPERRRRLEAARDLLAAFAAAGIEGRDDAPIWVVADDERLTAGPGAIVRADDPCAQAAARFDELAHDTALLAGAARRIRLESAGEFDPERHGPALDRLDWRSFSAAELALVVPLFALVDPIDLVARGLVSLSRLLLSGRPVAVVMQLDCAPADLDPAAPHFEPAMLGLGHRETFVHQGSVAEPLLLARGFANALAGSRPSLHVVDRPWFEVDGLDLAALARARVAGRAVPLVRHEPETGASWSRRLSLEGNPDPGSDWGVLPDGESASGLPFTFADAALLDPAWRSQFALADPAEGEATAELEPLALWLALPAERRAQTLPFVDAVAGSAGADGRRVRLVVSLALARAAADRLAFWRSLQELAGVRSEAVERAVSDAVRDSSARAAESRDELVRRHAEELEAARATAASAAVERIVSTLLAQPPLPASPAAGGGA